MHLKKEMFGEDCLIFSRQGSYDKCICMTLVGENHDRLDVGGADLTRDEVAELIQRLQVWLKTGSLQLSAATHEKETL